jgi:hypothetical protein
MKLEGSLAVLLSILALPLATAQTAGGRITGTVTDASGATLADASIKVTNERTGEERIATTNSSGEFVATHLDPSTYTCSDR